MKNASRRSFTSCRYAIPLLAALPLLAACSGSDLPPDLVLVTLDTLRVDQVGAYGSEAGLTPNLDELARVGLVHESAMTTMPTTGPAHASLMTGLAPYQHRVMRNALRLPRRLAPGTLASRLQQAGYQTAAFVTTSLLNRSISGYRGFAHYSNSDFAVRPGREVVSSTLAWLDETPDRPVFLWVHIYDPHSPYGPYAEKGAAHYVDPDEYGFVDPARFARPRAVKRMKRRYARGVRATDELLGSLIAGVRERLDDPLIVVVSDHGEAMDEHLESRGYAFDHGEFLDDEAIFIPLVLAGPGVTPGRSSGLASIRDLYTSLLAAAGLEDTEAEAAGRRDLRSIDNAPRLEIAERRWLTRREKRAVDDAGIAAVKRHEVAVSNGKVTVLLDSEGRVTSSGDAPEELVAAGRRRLELREGGGKAAETLDVDAKTEEALRGLGYIE